MKLEDHPTVAHFRRAKTLSAPEGEILDASWLKALAKECGADDAGLVELGRNALDGERPHILSFFPKTKCLLSIICRMNREPIRNPARSVSNLEFHHTGEELNEVARRIVSALEAKGISAINPSVGFPMEMDQFPGRVWLISHKPVAVAAGLGMMGIHRNVIHPKFGNFVLLGTVLIAAEATDYDQPLDYNPCLECKLCVAACPVGAVSSDGSFDFSACYTHNYREFMGGFTDWAGMVAESSSAADYRRKVGDSASASMWQSLSFGANYKAAYCMAVCPAGEDVIGPYLVDKGDHVKSVLRPLQEKQEPVYVVPGSDAETWVQDRFPHKRVRRVRNTLTPHSIQAFLNGLPTVFQRGKSAGLHATYHFKFSGEQAAEATIQIQDQTLSVEPGLSGPCDLLVTADSHAWLGFLAKERHLVWEWLRGRIRLKGDPRLLIRFGKCFPS